MILEKPRNVCSSKLKIYFNVFYLLYLFINYFNFKIDHLLIFKLTYEKLTHYVWKRNHKCFELGSNKGWEKPEGEVGAAKNFLFGLSGT